MGVGGPAAGLRFRGEENVRNGLGRLAFNSNEEVELLLDEDEITEAFRLSAARAAAAGDAEGVGPVEGGEGESTSTCNIAEQQMRAR